MKRLITLLLLSIFLVNCSQEETLSVENTNDTQHPNLVTTQMANVVSNKFMDKIMGTNGRGASKQIKESFPILKDSQPIMHVVNYEDGGFVVISGDNRIEPLLAYSETGYFVEGENKYPEGLKHWINHINNTISYIRENDVALPTELETYWKHYLSDEKEVDGRALKPTDQCKEIEDGLHDRTVGPLLSTEWDQGYPFNEQMPMVPKPNGDLVHAPVGCVPIAIAQVLKYHNYPTNYQWNNMPLEKDTCTQAIWTLFNDIHSRIGSAKIEYKWDGTTVYVKDHDDDSIDIGVFFKNSFGYSYAIQADYDHSTVKQEIFTYNRPVILFGREQNSDSGHAWVCDGANQWWTCIRAEDEYENDITFSYLQLHMNWGWGGYCDGWFSYGNFNPTGHQFSEDLKMVYKIVP